MVMLEAIKGIGLAAASGVAQLLGLTAKLVEVGALGQRSGHDVSLLRLRSAAQAEEEPTAMGSVVGGGLSPSRGPGGVLLSPPRIVAAPCRAAPRCDAYGTTFEERVIDDSSGRYL